MVTKRTLEVYIVVAAVLFAMAAPVATISRFEFGRHPSHATRSVYAASSNCTQCDPGLWSDATNPNCSTCATGSCFNHTCLRCPKNYFSGASGATLCKQCDPGYSANVGASVCATCSSGFTSSNGSDCAACPPGTACPGTGCPRCQECAVGNYMPLAGRSQCIPCSPASFSNHTGMASCYPCGQGYYSQVSGASDRSVCTLCPPGFYCPSDMTVLPQLCPRTAYCPGGTGSPVSCPPLYEGVDNEGCAARRDLIAIVCVCSVCGALLIIFVSYKYYSRSAGRSEEQTVLLTHQKEEKEDPVYSGY